LSKSHFHHYPGILGRFRSRNGLHNDSEIIKLILPYKSNLLIVEKFNY